jgi:hypothetical protein
MKDQAESLRRHFDQNQNRHRIQKKRQISVISALSTAVNPVQSHSELSFNLRAILRMIESESLKQRVKKYLSMGESSAASLFEFSLDSPPSTDDTLVVLEAQNEFQISQFQQLSASRVFVLVNDVTSSQRARDQFFKFKESLETKGWAEIHYLGHLSVTRGGNRFLPLLKWGKDKQLPEISQLCVQWIAKRLNELMEPTEG